MDDKEARAVRHKRHIVASNVLLGEETIAELTSRNLISNAILDNMKDDVTNFCRMVRYLELLENNPNGIKKGSFERLCNFLETSGKHWISDELRTELKTVRGELVIENYIRFEAQQLVDSQFGHIRRLSQMEKLDMQKIVAQRMQHYKEVWKRAIAEAEDNLREMNRLVSEKMSHQQRLIDKLEQYVRIHNKLAASADNSSSSNQEETSDNSEQQEQDALSAQLSSLLDSLKAMTADSVQGRQLVRDEKQRALRVIGVDDINRKLDAEVNSALDPVDQDLSNERSTLDSQLQRNNQLKDELRSIAEEQDRCLKHGDDTIQQLNERLAAAEKQGRDLRAEMHRLQQRIVQTRTRIGKYRTKSQVMNNVRNLGYVSGKLEVEKVDASDRMARQRQSIFDIKSSAAQPATRQPIRGETPAGARRSS